MNNEQVLETGPRPRLVVQAVHGNLTIRGWGEGRIRAQGSHNLQLQQSEEAVLLSCPGDCQIMTPLDTELVVEDARADTQIVEVRGAVTVQNCAGNLVMARVGPITLENTQADLTAKEVGGSLTVENVAGSASLAQIRGPLRLEHCAGDLSVKEVYGPAELDTIAGNAMLGQIHGPLRLAHCAGDLAVRTVLGPLEVDQVSGSLAADQVQGSLQANHCAGDLSLRGVTGNVDAKVDGSAKLKLAFPSGGICTVEAGGDITCRVPPTVDARVQLESGGEIRVKRLPVAMTRGEHSAEFTLGSGAGQITLSAGGSILLAGKSDTLPEFEFGPFNVEMDVELQQEFVERTGEWVQQMAEQVERQMETLADQLDARLAQVGTSEEIAARVQQKVQQAMRRAEEKIAAAMRQAEDRARAAEREAARRDRRTTVYSYQTPPRAPSPMPPAPPIPPVPPRRGSQPKRAPASDEERMLILRMLEQGKISVEQAEKLIAALES